MYIEYCQNSMLWRNVFFLFVKKNLSALYLNNIMFINCKSLCSQNRFEKNHTVLSSQELYENAKMNNLGNF